MRQIPTLMVVLAVLLPAQHGAAQGGAADKAAAEALFDQGLKLLKEGQTEAACQRLEQSQRIDPGIGTLLYLAECYEKLGRVASAWATFREAASMAEAAGQEERADMGRSRAEQLASKLSRLTITVGDDNAALEGFELLRGGEPVPRALWGIPVPVDPRAYVIEARAPGHAAYSTTVTVAAEADSVTLSVPPLEAAAPQALSPAVPETPLTQSPASADGGVGMQHDRPPPSSDGSLQRTLGWVAGGVGVVGIGVGSFFGLRAIQKNDDALEHCPSERCDHPDGERFTSEAQDAATLSNVAFGIGIAGLVGGAVLLLTAPSGSGPSGAEPTSARIATELGPGFVGARLQGAF